MKRDKAISPTKTKIIEITPGAAAPAIESLTTDAPMDESMAPVIARVTDAIETFSQVA